MALEFQGVGGIRVEDGILVGMVNLWYLPNGIELQGLKMGGVPAMVVLVEQYRHCFHLSAQSFARYHYWWCSFRWMRDQSQVRSWLTYS